MVCVAAGARQRMGRESAPEMARQGGKVVWLCTKFAAPYLKLSKAPEGLSLEALRTASR
jgi:hypothetical protein